MKFLAGIAPVIEPEKSFALLRQVVPSHINLVTVTSFENLTAQELDGVEVVLTALVPVSAGLIQKLPKLRMIQVFSHGFDHIDLEAATKRNIPVCNVGTSKAEHFDVAELAMLFMLALSRRFVEANNGMNRGEWNQPYLLNTLGLTELHEKTLGIIGLGEIGSDLARKAKAFDMHIIYTDRSEKPKELVDSLGASYRDLDTLMAEADYISINTVLNDSTRGMIDARRLYREYRAWCDHGQNGVS